MSAPLRRSIHDKTKYDWYACFVLSRSLRRNGVGCLRCANARDPRGTLVRRGSLYVGIGEPVFIRVRPRRMQSSPMLLLVDPRPLRRRGSTCSGTGMTLNCPQTLGGVPMRPGPQGVLIGTPSWLVVLGSPEIRGIHMVSGFYVGQLRQQRIHRRMAESIGAERCLQVSHTRDLRAGDLRSCIARAARQNRSQPCGSGATTSMRAPPPPSPPPPARLHAARSGQGLWSSEGVLATAGTDRGLWGSSCNHHVRGSGLGAGRLCRR